MMRDHTVRDWNERRDCEDLETHEGERKRYEDRCEYMLTSDM
jgi:hypothetical protein